jgi:phytoene dehydrogenase-like protein
MDDERATQAWDTVVVGGGLGGLLAAIAAAPPHRGRAAQRPRVALIDPHPLGGRARVDRRGGFVLNRGPRALYVGGPAHRILEDLGVDVSHGAPPTLGASAARAGGVLHRFPGGPVAAARTTLLSPRDKVAVARATARIVRPRPDEGAGSSVAAWLDEQRLQGRARAFLEALVRVSTYAHAPDRLDARLALANARLGMTSGVRYLDGGWQSLVDQLAAIAAGRGVEVIADHVERLVVDRPEGAADAAHWLVTGRRGVHRARSVVVAAGTPQAAAGILGARPPSWGAPGPEATAACLELGVRCPPPRRFVLGIDEPTYLSTHAPPARLAPEGQAVVHLMRYLAPGEELPADAVHAQLRDLARAAGVADDDIVVERFLARMVVTASLPTPDRPRPAVAVAEHPGVFVAGDWVGGEGLLLDAVAASALEAGRLAAATAVVQAAAGSATMAGR